VDPPHCVHDRPLGLRYTASVYFVLTTITSTGYGDITPVKGPGKLRRERS
jgi:hypothetical protein